MKMSWNMPRNQRILTPDDIMDLGAFETIRAEKRQENLLRKRFRRLSIGPHVSVHFENWDTMWWQVHEMLRIEKGGEEQLKDELARSEEHTSELQSLMSNSYAVFCLKKKQ